jgi:hypothetical protein
VPSGQRRGKTRRATVHLGITTTATRRKRLLNVENRKNLSGSFETGQSQSLRFNRFRTERVELFFLLDLLVNHFGRSKLEENDIFCVCFDSFRFNTFGHVFFGGDDSFDRSAAVSKVPFFDVTSSSHFFFDFFSKKQEKKQFLSKLFFSLSRMKNRRFNNRNKRKKLLAKNVNALKILGKKEEVKQIE